MTCGFRKVAVIGAGTMGSGIAGQVANAGIEVLLLDMPSEGDDPNTLARRGYRRLLDPAQPGLMDRQAGERIRLGNIRDDMHRLSDCDWIAEAVVERLDVKRALYREVFEVAGDRAIITSNTSTIPIRLLVEEMPHSRRSRFAVTHFFNPVRFMRLLELVGGDETDPAVMDRLESFCDEQLGKGVVRCRDTPGFLANRIGVYAIQCALQAAVRLGLTAVEADAVFGRPMGIPKTGVFGLYDLIGIDLMADVVSSLVAILPPEDPFHAESGEIPLMTRMIANGQTGNKQGRGFYKDGAGDGGRLVLNRDTETYEPFTRANLPLAEAAERDGMSRLLEDRTKYGDFAWEVLSKTLSYAASLVPEISDDPVAIDDAMKLGYNWVQGPFEMLDSLGVSAVADRLESEVRSVPGFLQAGREHGFYSVRERRLGVIGADGRWSALARPEGVIRLGEVCRMLSPEVSAEAASWYACDAMAVVVFHSKANALNGESMAVLHDAVKQVRSRGLKGLLVHNDAPHFSCGVNLGTIRDFCRRDDMDGLDRFLADFQQTVIAMRDADYPVVVAPAGLSLGGGFEIVLHGKQVVFHANSVMGLVETAVGVVPSGGGCKEMLYRWIGHPDCRDDLPGACWKAFMNTGYGKTATSPGQALDLAMVRDNDSYQVNRDRMYRASVDALLDGTRQKPFSRPVLYLPGQPVFSKMQDWLRSAHAEKGILTPHDVVVGTEIARIMSGGDVEPGTAFSEQDLLDEERRSFLALAQQPATLARLDSMLDSGKPLRN